MVGVGEGRILGDKLSECKETCYLQHLPFPLGSVWCLQLLPVFSAMRHAVNDAGCLPEMGVTHERVLQHRRGCAQHNCQWRNGGTYDSHTSVVAERRLWTKLSDIVDNSNQVERSSSRSGRLTAPRSRTEHRRRASVSMANQAVQQSGSGQGPLTNGDGADPVQPPLVADDWLS